jgi:hypothetical protein
LKIIIISCCIFLTACSPFSIPSIVFNGVDVITFWRTGKTVSDHAISEVAQQDCAIWRVVKGEKICSVNKDQLPPIEGDQLPLIEEMMEASCEIYSWTPEGKFFCKNAPVVDFY